MLFVAICKATATMRERMARRLDYTWPEGMTVLAEYWLQTPDPGVIVVTEADSIEAMMAAVTEWDDVFDISIFPAVTAEDGLRLAKASLAGAMTG